jgi:hypothetical protein
VALWDVLLYVVEVAELGARMATRLGCKSVAFDVGLVGITGRELVSGNARRHLYGPYVSAAHAFSAAKTVDTTGLLTDTRTIGVELAQGILRQFGADLPDQVLHEYQDEVLSARG